jgi:hypothetical protein
MKARDNVKMPITWTIPDDTREESFSTFTDEPKTRKNER